MKAINELLQGYENTKLIHYDDIGKDFPNTVEFGNLKDREVHGVLKANKYTDGKLMQTYSQNENHVGVIAATRLGKTTSYVVPTIISFARSKVKKSMIISDPKGELYRHTAATLKEEGYKVLLLNFRDFVHSECWNPLTPIYRKYRSIYNIYDEVKLVDTPDGPRNEFRGKIYEDQRLLDEDINSLIGLINDDVGNDIDQIAMMICPTLSQRDPYWEDSARDFLKAFLWAMLEDSRPENIAKTGRKQITEDTYSFATIISLMALLNGPAGDFDGGYFSSRPQNSMARRIEQSTIPEHAQTTRQCITSVFSTKMSVFRETAMRLVTGCNSFEMDILTGDDPVAIYIDYRDELKVHYTVISLFIQDAYRRLIAHANYQDEGKRKIPFYFILDEFGNFPAIKDFETTISACAGRNIFFILIIQSYAQLDCVYGKDVAEVIRDNLNMHVFFGSNNPNTLTEFSNECGMYSRISPVSALGGSGSSIDDYRVETINLIPKSLLANLSSGECIVTEANCGYVMYSKLERYYACKEFNELPLDDERQYKCPVNPIDRKYVYTVKVKRNPFDF